MTRRERLEARAERRREWAGSRTRKSEAAFERARVVADGIPLGQPVLVGHHSERHHRRDLARIDAGMAQGCESAKMADHHASKADGIEAQLERSIFSDDSDALEALEAKAAALDRDAERANAINAAWRKHLKATEAGDSESLFAAWAALGIGPKSAERMRGDAMEFSWTRRKGPASASYARANARRARQRIEEVKRLRERAAEAEAAPGGVVIRKAEGVDWCSVTFAEKPSRARLEALRAAGFHWGAGCWSGRTSALPACVAERGAR